MKTMTKIRMAACAILIAIVSCAATVHAGQAQLDVSLAQPVLKAGEKHSTFLKVGLTGFELKSDADRTPVNVALVLDRSGSMSGSKLEQAKAAAKAAIDRLGNRDIVSVVMYDTNVEVIVPATKVSDKDSIKRKIDSITSGGSTALFAGVSKGAAEVKKFLDKNRVNRVILLSDGLANVGPSSPAQLADLGSSLGKDNISVSTIGLGLGYNEDLMARLARSSDGNHAFVESEGDLARIFNYEFGDVLSVVAQEVMIRIKVDEGIRPVRVLGRDAEISGQTVICSLNQIYSKQEKYVMLEIEVPAGAPKSSRDVASVEVSYANMATKTTDTLTSELAVRFTDDVEVAAKNEDKDVMVAAITHVANEQNKLAFALRDQGKVDEARKVLESNAGYLEQKAAAYDDEELQKLQKMNWNQAEVINKPAASEDFQRARKGAYEAQEKIDNQRDW